MMASGAKSAARIWSAIPAFLASGGRLQGTANSSVDRAAVDARQSRQNP